MIKVLLISSSGLGVPELASFAAKTCYQAEEPKIGELIDIENALFKTGHHTTLQHSYFTFFIDGIAVSDVTLGLHLANPFYNTSQRSGRFCAKMFANPDYETIGRYIKNYWPELDKRCFSDVLDVIRRGIDVYQFNIAKAIEIAKTFIRIERPLASEKYIEQNAPKFAQEQMRMFISTIFPTALVYTINLSAIAAMYSSAWSPVMMDVTQKMADVVLKKHPELTYLFQRNSDSFIKSIPRVGAMTGIGTLKYEPWLDLISLGDDVWFMSGEPESTYPIDTLHFDPIYMDNNVAEIKTNVEISLATMGQDQRHRTVRRSKPAFTGNFYLPPVAKIAELYSEAVNLLYAWGELAFNKNIPYTLRCAIAPYGAMVSYGKSASYNAAMHELGKRLCWCAQEEIFHLALNLKETIVSEKGGNSIFHQMFSPACVRIGQCGEGKRYCGRDIEGDCFIKRKV